MTTTSACFGKSCSMELLLDRESEFPEVRAEVFHAGIACQHDDRLSAARAAQQLQRGGEIRSAGEAGEDSFIARQAASSANGFVVGYFDVAVDWGVLEGSEI